MSDDTNKNTEIVNAIIESASIQMHHGVFLSMWLMLEYGGSCQGFGGYVLGGEPNIPAGDHANQANIAAEFIVSCMRAAGVERFDQLKGKSIRVRRIGGWGGAVDAIGHITKNDRWFCPSERLESMKAGAK